MSFWGGVDDETGRIIDAHHPQVGTSVAGSALVMGATRGSSSSTSTLLECIRRGTAPSILVLATTDPILVVAAAVAWELYGHGPSVVLIHEVPDTVGVEGLRLDQEGKLWVSPSTVKAG